MADTNVYRPYIARIEKITEETPDTRSFRLVFVDDEVRENFTFQAGQFGEYSVFGEGESTFCIASSPTRKGYIECTFKKVGRVTKALGSKLVGDVIGFRGPYGNTFPVESWEGKDLVFIAGGIGLAPIRCVIWAALDNREKYGNITIVYGARTPEDLVYKYELEEWKKRDDVNLLVTVDPGDVPGGGDVPADWDGSVGYVPSILEKAAPSSANSVAVVCGPPIMIKLTLPVLTGLGFTPDRIYTTLENRMKCGIGKCGRCNIGKFFVCKDGPVFTFEEISKLPPEF